MIIEELEFLKVWLVNKLEPICDADPSALAKYVIALAKKDKPEQDLKALCEDQLDVFLGDETKVFVADLFKTLDQKDYIPVTLAKTVASDQNNQEVTEQKGKKRKSFEEADQKESEKILKTESKIDVSKLNHNIENVKEGSKPLHVQDGNGIETGRTDVSSVDEKIPKVSEKDRHLKNAKSEDYNMRSVSQDRSVKGISPSIRTRHSHSSRRKPSRSPNRSSSRQHSRSSRRERSRREHREGSRERRSRRRKKEKCRDYEEKGFCMLGESCPYDHGYDPVEVDDRNLPQMLSLAGIPSTQGNKSTLPAQPIQLIPGVLPGARPLIQQLNNTLPLNTGLATVQVQRQRPVASPAELPGQVPIFRPRNPAAFLRNISPPMTSATQPKTTMLSTSVTTSTVKSGEPYNPEEPSIEVEESDTVPKDVADKKLDIQEMTVDDNRTQDELVQIAMGNVPLTPIVGNQPSNIFQVNSGVNHQNQPSVSSVQQVPFHAFQPASLMQRTYLPMAITQQNYPLQMQQQTALMAPQVVPQPAVVPIQTAKQPFRRSTVLEIRKIPKDLNNIVKLSEHFQKFGSITKLQTPFENDGQAALIEFSTHQEASSAYNSPEAILGNRFIKMFWHNPNRKHPNSTGASADNSKATPSEATETKTKKIASSEELRYVNPKNDPKVQMEKQKELEKLRLELMKKKQTHYDELVKKQKDILLKLQENKNLSKEDKARFLKAFKHCDGAVQKLKKELEEDAKAKQQTSANVSVKAYKDTKKEILDKEIDIYHGNLQGEELLEAKKVLEQLKREAYGTSQGRGFRGRGRGRGRGSWYGGRGRGRGRGGAFQSSSVDNRPKQILVSGFEAAEKDDVLAHFAAFGPLDRIEESAPDKMILTFPTRQSAEIAAIQGGEYQGKQLVLAWFTGKKNVPDGNGTHKIQRRMTRSLSQSLMDKDLDDELLELDKDEEELLLAGVDDDDDEDEEMESDERSWRR